MKARGLLNIYCRDSLLNLNLNFEFVECALAGCFVHKLKEKERLTLQFFLHGTLRSAFIYHDLSLFVSPLCVSIELTLFLSGFRRCHHQEDQSGTCHWCV
jgi:hypothetical protein